LALKIGRICFSNEISADGFSAAEAVTATEKVMQSSKPKIDRGMGESSTGGLVRQENHQ
jgi:hypothetical protein